eukprot:NODE_2109_length_1277_cov_19.748696_g2006_i0.p1 GENE.NODE_2109_length_1277_cov_19.748696_g2006_i0~~NODE_2109_length_1277_cov_19.748696_g2006_i0.p1  ORF type:complete len:404 (+),score=59.62 NODE_2109_length_1277_cov_19.748696_g2006_i0:16-1227(+)
MEVCRWLQTLGLEEQAPTFLENEFTTLSTVKQLEPSDLAAMHIADRAAQTILRAVANLNGTAVHLPSIGTACEGPVRTTLEQLESDQPPAAPPPLAPTETVASQNDRLEELIGLYHSLPPLSSSPVPDGILAPPGMLLRIGESKLRDRPRTHTCMPEHLAGGRSSTARAYKMSLSMGLSFSSNFFPSTTPSATHQANGYVNRILQRRSQHQLTAPEDCQGNDRVWDAFERSMQSLQSVECAADSIAAVTLDTEHRLRKASAPAKPLETELGSFGMKQLQTEQRLKISQEMIQDVVKLHEAPNSPTAAANYWLSNMHDTMRRNHHILSTLDTHNSALETMVDDFETILTNSKQERQEAAAAAVSLPPQKTDQLLTSGQSAILAHMPFRKRPRPLSGKKLCQLVS